MHRLLPKLREQRARHAKDDRGFTLIELLVVVVILGVLIAIAIPLYLNYRKGANDAATQSDTRNAISVLEACNSSNGAYPTQVAAVTWTASTAPCTSQTINFSAGTSMKYISASGVSYMLVGTNSSGATKYYCYNSSTAAPVASVTAASLSAATC